jgi:prepilin-type N-terminal cleavage/methylation domain-containing protein
MTAKAILGKTEKSKSGGQPHSKDLCLKDDPNGFSLVEVIMALLVLSLALGGTFELFRVGLTYRNLTETSAHNLEGAMLVKKMLDVSLSDTQIAQVNVGPDLVTYNGQPLVKLVRLAQPTIMANDPSRKKGLKVERYEPNGRRAKLTQSVTLQTSELVFEPRFSPQGQLTHIVIGTATGTAKPPATFTPLAMSQLSVSGPRPCAFDALMGGCLDGAQ